MLKWWELFFHYNYSVIMIARIEILTNHWLILHKVINLTKGLLPPTLKKEKRSQMQKVRFALTGENYKV